MSKRKKKGNGSAVKPPPTETTTAKQDLRTLPADKQKKLSKGKVAYKQLRLSYEHHCTIRDCIKVLSDLAKQVTGANDEDTSSNKLYQNKFHEYLVEQGWGDMDSAYRSRLLRLTPEHDAWRAGLTEAEQFRLNNPLMVLVAYDKWKKAKETPAPEATQTTVQPPPIVTPPTMVQPPPTVTPAAPTEPEHEIQTGDGMEGQDDSEQGDDDGFKNRLDDWQEYLAEIFDDDYLQENKAGLEAQIQAAKVGFLALGVSEEDFESELKMLHARYELIVIGIAIRDCEPLTSDMLATLMQHMGPLSVAIALLHCPEDFQQDFKKQFEHHATVGAAA